MEISEARVERFRGLFHRRHIPVIDRIVRIEYETNALSGGNAPFTEFHPLSAEFRSKVTRSSDVPTGRARLATKPRATGSPLVTMMMGIVVVALLAARVPGVPDVKIRSTLSPTSSVAKSGKRA